MPVREGDKNVSVIAEHAWQKGHPINGEEVNPQRVVS